MTISQRCTTSRHRQTFTLSDWSEERINRTLERLCPLARALDDLDLPSPALERLRDALHELPLPNYEVYSHPGHGDQWPPLTRDEFYRRLGTTDPRGDIS
jgi:hypothetical protein